MEKSHAESTSSRKNGFASLDIQILASYGEAHSWVSNPTISNDAFGGKCQLRNVRMDDLLALPARIPDVPSAGERWDVLLWQLLGRHGKLSARESLL